MSNNIEKIKKPDSIISYWKKEPFVLSLILIFGLAFNICVVLAPVYQGRLLDTIAKGQSFLKILTAAVIFAGVVTLIQTSRLLKRFYIRKFANSTQAVMQLSIYNNLIYKSVPEINGEDIGNLLTRAISDVNLCVNGMRKATTEVFDTGVLMLSYLVTMLIYDVKITLISIVLAPLAMLIAAMLKSVIYKYSIAYRQKSSKLTSVTYDLVENSVMYRLNGRENDNSAEYLKHLEELKAKAVKAHLLESSMQPLYNIIAMTGIIVVIILGGQKTVNGAWSVGEFSAYMTMFIAMALKASKAAKLFNTIQKSQVSWFRIKPYLSEYKEKDKSSDVKAGETSLKVENLNFSYQNGENIIEDISFLAKSGQIIGVTGPIAVGKSTLGLALTGLYEYKGSILIDKKELRDYSDNERSLMISYLSHRPQLMSDTIYNNITLGNQGDISEVLCDAGFWADLSAMPSGQETFVGNGGIRLSGGQQARIALARTLVNKNKIIILDDPFSNIDMKTEQEILEGLRNNYKDSLIILISHRLAVFDKLDNILLLNNDKSYIFGKHAELLEKSQTYKAIYNLQTAFKDGADYE